MGNKVSIKEKFESFVAVTAQENVIPALKEILTQKISDDDTRQGILPQVIRKFIQENPETFSTTITEVLFATFIP